MDLVSIERMMPERMHPRKMAAPPANHWALSLIIQRIAERVKIMMPEVMIALPREVIGVALAAFGWNMWIPDPRTYGKCSGGNAFLGLDRQVRLT